MPTSKRSSSTLNPLDETPEGRARLAEITAKIEARPSPAQRQRDNERLAFARRVLGGAVDVMVRRQIAHDPLGSDELDDLVKEFAGGIPAEVQSKVRAALAPDGNVGALVAAGSFGSARETARELTITLANELEGRKWAPPAAENPRDLAASIERW